MGRAKRHVGRGSSRRLAGRVILEAHDERLFDREYRVGIEEGVPRHEEVRGHRLVARSGHDGMYVRRTIGMAARRSQEDTDRAVGGNLVADRSHGAKTIATVSTALEFAARVGGAFAGVALNAVETVA